MQFAVYKNELERYCAVKYGFNWFAFLFPIMWSAANKMWGIAGMVFVVSQITLLFSEFINLYYGLDINFVTLYLLHGLIYGLISGLILGGIGNQFLRQKLTDRGFKYKDTIDAKTNDGAISARLEWEKSEQSKDYKTCPNCAESIKKIAKVCKYCSFNF